MKRGTVASVLGAGALALLFGACGTTDEDERTEARPPSEPGAENVYAVKAKTP